MKGPGYKWGKHAFANFFMGLAGTLRLFFQTEE
jgi:hypothetical protein